MTTVLKDNFDALRWDAEQKNTAKENFSLQWQNTITASVNPRKIQLESDIKAKTSLMTELQSLQAFVASISSEGSILKDLVSKYPSLASIFTNADDHMAYLLSQPPMTFLVSNKIGKFSLKNKIFFKKNIHKLMMQNSRHKNFFKWWLASRLTALQEQVASAQ